MQKIIQIVFLFVSHGLDGADQLDIPIRQLLTVRIQIPACAVDDVADLWDHSGGDIPLTSLPGSYHMQADLPFEPVGKLISKLLLCDVGALPHFGDVGALFALYANHDSFASKKVMLFFYAAYRSICSMTRLLLRHPVL